MNGLIRFSLGNRRAITVLVLAIVLLGVIALLTIPADILPVYKSPAVQVLTFYGGMPATSVEADITARMERWCGQAAGTERQESRSIVGASIVRNYFADDIDPNGSPDASQFAGHRGDPQSAARHAAAGRPSVRPDRRPRPSAWWPSTAIPRMNRRFTTAGRYQVRNMIMASRGANSPVVYGGRLRTILAFLDRDKLQARNLSAVDVMNALDRYNIFMPAGDVKIGIIDYALDSNSMYQDG